MSLSASTIVVLLKLPKLPNLIWKTHRDPVSPPYRVRQGRLLTDVDYVMCLCRFPLRTVHPELNHNTLQQHPFDY